MKTFNLLTISLAFGAAALLTSCQKEPQTSAVTDDGVKSIALSINFGGAATKATIDDELDEPFTEASTFDKLAIFFTDNSDNILYAFEASDASDEGTDEETIWDNLFKSTGAGVRFIGLEGVKGIYVVANGPALSGDGSLGLTFEAAAEGQGTRTGGKVSNESPVNISTINAHMDIIEYFSQDKDATDMPFIGATKTFNSVGTVGGEDAEVVLGADAGQYYQADITIRPAVSRLEVQKVSVVTTGTSYFTLADDGVTLEPCETEGEADYRVTWEGFNPTLVGAYMSNFYTNTNYFPANASLTDWNGFETPSFDDVENGEAPIMEGKWNVAEGDLSAAINGLVSYSNYEGTSYGALVSDTYSGGTNTEKPEATYVFDGNKDNAGRVIPFNFFVPYDITSTLDNTSGNESEALTDVIIPKLHIQLQKPASGFLSEAEKKDTDGSWIAVPADEINISTQLTTPFTWPTVADGEPNIAFVNVRMGTQAGDDVTLRPGYIYKMDEIMINPVNVNGSVTSSDLNNIFVTVTVVGYTIENVYPVFD